MYRLLWLGAFVSVLAVSLSAQQAQPPDSPKQKRERWIERLQKELQLSPQQQEQLRALFREHQQRLQQERQRFREQFSQLLTPEQQEKLKQLLKERRERLQHFRKQLRQWLEDTEPEGPPYR